jgi:hypothetical protein
MGTTRKPEPSVPLSAAEMLYVCLATAQQSSKLDERTKENIGLILSTYRVRRDASCKLQGCDEVDIKHYSAAAAEALANWLDDRADKAEAEEENEDFAAFERQFGEQQAQDPNQGTEQGGQRRVFVDDGAGAFIERPTTGEQRGPDGTEVDPGEQDTN